MHTIAAVRPARWYGSFYWRIGVSFVVVVIAVLVAQSAMFNYIAARNPPFRGRSPNNLSAIVSADLGYALCRIRQPIFDSTPIASTVACSRSMWS